MDVARRAILERIGEIRRKRMTHNINAREDSTTKTTDNTSDGQNNTINNRGTGSRNTTASVSGDGSDHMQIETKTDFKTPSSCNSNHNKAPSSNCNVNPRILLVGSSFGGRIALELVRDGSISPEKTLLFAPAVGIRMQGSMKSVIFRECFPEVTDARELKEENSGLSTGRDHAGCSSTSPLTGGDASPLTGGDASPLTGGDASQLTGGAETDALVASGASRASPIMIGLPWSRVTIIHGTSDQVVPIEASRDLKKKFPELELIELENCGHRVGLDFEFAFEDCDVSGPSLDSVSAMAESDVFGLGKGSTGTGRADSDSVAVSNSDTARAARGSDHTNSISGIRRRSGTEATRQSTREARNGHFADGEHERADPTSERADPQSRTTDVVEKMMSTDKIDSRRTSMDKMISRVWSTD
jgi:hypothetical protein